MTVATCFPPLTKGKFKRYAYSGVSPRGIPFGVGVFSDQSGQTHPVIADGEENNLDFLPHMTGLDVRLVTTERGYRLAPWSEQFGPTQAAVVERLHNPDEAQMPIGLDEPEAEASVAMPGQPESFSLAADLRGIIDAAAEVAQRRGMACGGWVLVPVPKPC